MINIVSTFSSLPAPVLNRKIGKSAALLRLEHKTRRPPPCHIQFVGFRNPNFWLLMSWWRHWLRQNQVEKGRDWTDEALLQNIRGFHICHSTETGDLYIYFKSFAKCLVTFKGFDFRSNRCYVLRVISCNSHVLFLYFTFCKQRLTSTTSKSRQITRTLLDFL